MNKIMEINGYGTDTWVLVRDKQCILGEYGEPNKLTENDLYFLYYNPSMFTCDTTGEIIWYSPDVYCTHFLEDILDLIAEIINNTKTKKDFEKWCDRHEVTLER